MNRIRIKRRGKYNCFNKMSFPIIFLLFILSCTACAIKQETQGHKSQEIICTNAFDSLVYEYTQEIIHEHPQIAFSFRSTEGYIFPDSLTDNSVNAINKRYRMAAFFLQKLENINRETLHEADRINYDILRVSLQDDLRGEKFRFHNYEINTILSTHASLISHFTGIKHFCDVGEAKSYVSRLKQYSSRLENTDKILNEQIDKKILPPSDIIEEYIANIEDFLSPGAKNNYLSVSFNTMLKSSKNLTKREISDLNRQVTAIMTEEIYPAYKNHLALCRKALSESDMNAGVWKLPDGDDYYRFCLRSHTNTFMTPEEIHNIGLSEVSRIQNEIRKLIGTENELISFSELLNNYKQNSDNYYNKSASPKAILSDYQQIIDETWNKLPALFRELPDHQVKVRNVPDELKYVKGAQYEYPDETEEFGTFFVNLHFYYPDKAGLKALTFHEAIPGHHLQVSLQNENQQIPLFRKFLFFTAYVEGWALYAEKLAMEEGWYLSKEEKIGYYCSELFRAVRLVLDTGIHYKRWSREQAEKYMFENLGWSSAHEISRYIVWPGQACAYKIGEIKIVELRNIVKQGCGDNFNIKEFHDLLLNNGSMPLEVMEKLITDSISRQYY